MQQLSVKLFGKSVSQPKKLFDSRPMKLRMKTSHIFDEWLADTKDDCFFSAA